MNRTVRTAIFLIVCLGISVLFGMVVGQLAKSSEFIPKDIDHPWLLLVGSVLAMFVVLAFHELGHLLMSLSQGFVFQLFVVGFLGIKRKEDDSIKVYFNTDWNLFGGVAATTPKDYSADTLKQMAKVILAGPIASLLLILIAMLAAVFTDGAFRLLFCLTALLSFMILLATTLPSQTGLFYTDRKRYQRLKSEGEEKEIEGALAMAGAQKLMKKPMTDLPVDELQKITGDESPLICYIGYFYLFEYYLMSKETEALEAVKTEMQDLEQSLPKTLVKQFNAELEKLVVHPLSS